MPDVPDSPVIISAAECRKADIDYVAEIFASLDTPRRFGDLILPPPTLGVFALWELCDCQFFRSPDTCDVRELGRALWICRDRENARPAVEAYVYRDDDVELDRGALDVLRAGGDGLISDLAEVIMYCHTIPWEGFRMIPKAEDEDPTPFLFDGERLGLLCSIGAEAGLSAHEVLWRTPFTRLGHLAAAQAKKAGVEGVERPYDHEDVVEKLNAARTNGTNLWPK